MDDVFVGGYIAWSYFNFGGHSLSNCAPGYENTLTMKFNSTGGMEWMQTNGGSGYTTVDHGFIVSHDPLTSLAIDYSGNVFIAGRFRSATMVFGDNTITSGGGSAAGYDDMFLVKIKDSLLRVMDFADPKRSLCIYPVPANNSITVRWAGDTEISYFEITDAMGRIVLTVQNNTATRIAGYTHACVGLPPGLTDGTYYIRAVSKTETSVGRFVKFGEK